MTVSIDRRIFSDSVISKAVYWMSGDFTIARQMVNDHTENIEISHNSSNNISNAEIEQLLMQSLNDFKLREIVADETRDIKTILYAKAFAEDEDLSEDDIHD